MRHRHLSNLTPLSIRESILNSDATRIEAAENQLFAELIDGAPLTLVDGRVVIESVGPPPPVRTVVAG